VIVDSKGRAIVVRRELLEAGKPVAADIHAAG
jgi:hypothetical protein